MITPHLIGFIFQAAVSLERTRFIKGVRSVHQTLRIECLGAKVLQRHLAASTTPRLASRR